jgi:hypothetical protein
LNENSGWKKGYFTPKEESDKVSSLTCKEWVELEIQKISSACGGCLTLSETVASRVVNSIVRVVLCSQMNHSLPFTKQKLYGFVR